ncbi:hypothetical protein HpMMM19_03710 [Helicobacter pylori]
MNIGSVLNEFVTTFHFIAPNFPLLQTALKLNDFHLKISPTIRIGCLEQHFNTRSLKNERRKSSGDGY